MKKLLIAITILLPVVLEAQDLTSTIDDPRLDPATSVSGYDVMIVDLDRRTRELEEASLKIHGKVGSEASEVNASADLAGDSFLSRHKWKLSALAALVTFFVTDEGQEVGQDGIDWLRGHDGPDRRRDQDRDNDEGNTALSNDTQSDDLIVNGKHNNIDIWDESLSDIVVRGEGNSVSINRPHDTAEE